MVPESKQYLTLHFYVLTKTSFCSKTVIFFEPLTNATLEHAQKLTVEQKLNQPKPLQHQKADTVLLGNVTRPVA